ncbi:hypothetical protein APU02_15680 [Citrobacter sp. 50677481]|nr:hypothetical protein APU02_15680 [Citrobacter sp. 50677481]
MMFLSSDFFRLAQLGQIGAHQRLSERRRYRVNSLSQVFIVDYEKPAEAGFSGWIDYATFSSEQLHTGIGKGWPFLA